MGQQEQRDGSTVVTTRVTNSTATQLDRIARETGMSRGHVVSLMILHTLGYEDDVFGLYRASFARRRRGI